MEGYFELQQLIREDLGVEPEKSGSTEDPETAAEVESAVASELRTALEAVLENEDYSAEEVAALISTLTDALEEIDPDVFAADEDASEEEYGEYDEDDDYDYDEDEDYEDLEDEEGEELEGGAKKESDEIDEDEEEDEEDSEPRPRRRR